MSRLILLPTGFPCSVDECPPGPFIWKDQKGGVHLGLKSEYRTDNRCDAYNEAGEYFAQRDGVEVHPVTVERIED